MKKCTCPKPLTNGLLDKNRNGYLHAWPFMVACKRWMCPIHSKFANIDNVLDDLNSRKYGSWDGVRNV